MDSAGVQKQIRDTEIGIRNVKGLAAALATVGSGTSAISGCMVTSERGNYFYTSANTFLTTAMQSACTSVFMNTSERANYQTTGAYLTTAMESACTSVFMNTSERANYQTTGNYLTTAMQSACSSNFQSTGNYLTTAMQSACTSVLAASTHTHGALALTNITGTSASDGLSLSVNPPGAGGGAAIQGSGTYSQNTGTVQFANSNDMTFGLSNNGVMTGSFSVTAPYLTTAMQSACTSVFQFSSAMTPYLTTAMQSACTSVFQFSSAMTAYAANTHTHGSAPSITGGIGVTSNSSAWSISVGAYLTTAMQSACSSNFQSTGAYLTTAMQSACTSALLNNFSIGGNTGTTGSSNVTGGAFVVAGGSNVTLSQSNNTISIHAAGGVGGGLGAVGVTNSSNAFTSGSVMFSEQANITISSSVNGASQYLRFSVAAPGGGAGATISAWNPREMITGSFTSSHVPDYYFVPVMLPAYLAMSKAIIVKSFNVGPGAFTSQNSQQSHTWTLRHDISIFSRSNYAANSSQLVTVASGSVGFSFCGSYTSSSHSLRVSYVTNSTGGTTSWSTASVGAAYTTYWTGLKQIQVPLVTTLAPGEYYFAHKHSTGWATAGNASAKTWYSVSNLNMSNQIVTIGGIGYSGSLSRGVGWGGVGVGLGYMASSDMAATINISKITATIGHVPWQAFVNLPVTTAVA